MSIMSGQLVKHHKQSDKAHGPLFLINFMFRLTSIIMIIELSLVSLYSAAFKHQ